MHSGRWSWRRRGSEQAGSAHFGVGGSALALGRPTEAIEHFEQAAQLNSGGEKPWTIGTRPDVLGQAFCAHALWLVGRSDDALETSHHAVMLARTAEHPFSLAVALAYRGDHLSDARRQRPGLRTSVDELCDLCERYDFAYYREWALILSGWSRPGASGLERVRRGVANLRAEGSFARMPYWLSLLADVQRRDGDDDAARATLDAAIVEGTRMRICGGCRKCMRLRAALEPDEPARLERLRGGRRAGGRARQHGADRTLPARLRRAGPAERSFAFPIPFADANARRTPPFLTCVTTATPTYPEGDTVTTTSDRTTAPYTELAAMLRGELITAEHASYDAGPCRLQRDDRQVPGSHRQMP